jgi:glycosyltransferase involved in cell wall biosynthesis
MERWKRYMANYIPDVTFVVNRSGNPVVFEKNFAASPCLEGIATNRIIIQEGFPSASLGYNDGIDRAETDLIVFCHQDVYFPKEWLANLGRSLSMLEKSDPEWGVLGCYGIKTNGPCTGYVYSVGLGIVGKPFIEPVAIDTLDEFVLIMRKSSNLRFDPALPHFHFYGTDICMTARMAKKNSYAICAFSIHNTSFGPLAPDFFMCYWPIKKKWAKYLPIQTPCIKITRWNEHMFWGRFKLFCLKLLGRDMTLRPRLDDPRIVLRNDISSAV